MGMGSGSGPSKAVSGINVTPLIDVLLVLLIIFMAIVPVTPRGLEALVPQPPKPSTTQLDPDVAIVVQVLANRGAAEYQINGKPVTAATIERSLTALFAARRNKVMFIQGDKDLEYRQIAKVIDLGSQAGVANVGILTPQTLKER